MLELDRRAARLLAPTDLVLVVRLRVNAPSPRSGESVAESDEWVCKAVPLDREFADGHAIRPRPQQARTPSGAGRHLPQQSRKGFERGFEDRCPPGESGSLVKALQLLAWGVASAITGRVTEG